MNGTISSTTPSTICRCWSGSRALWTRRLRYRAGSCQKISVRFAGFWSPAWDGGVSRNSCRCSGCWRPSHSKKCTQPSRTLSGWGAEFRRGEAPGAVPIGGTAAPPRPGTVSLPAPGEGEHHIGQGLHALAVGESGMNDRSTLLLEHHLKELKLPSFLREYGKDGGPVRRRSVDHPQYLLRLAELELIRPPPAYGGARIRAARFPAVKSLDTFDFTAIPSVNKALVMELARCEYIQRRENIIALGNKRHRQDPHGPGAGPGRLPSGGCPWDSPRPPRWSTS